MSPRISHIAPALLALAMLSLTACGGGDDGAVAAGSGNAGNSPGATGIGAATLSWIPPAENTDGTSVADLAGYHIYRGTTQGSLALVRTITNPGITTVVLDGLAAGTHYFSVSAFLTSGLESDPSTIGSKTIP